MDIFLDDFHAKLKACKDQQACLFVFETLLKSLGFDLWAYSLTSNSGEIIQLETNYDSNWVQHYIASNYNFIDPVVSCAQLSHSAFRWGDLPDSLDLSQEQKQFFDEASLVDLGDGIAIPFRLSNEKRLTISLVNAEDNSLALYQKQNAHSLSVAIFLLYSRLENLSRQSAVGLSPREYDCLNWLAQGKTSWEIAKILSITERTVNFHVDNIKKKLQASNRSDAIAKGLYLGLIAP